MKCLAAVSKGLAASLPEEQLFRVNIDGVSASIALLDVKQVKFDEHSKQHQHSVLVKVQAFSLNYRERNRVLSIQQQADKEYKVLGSEFVGEVMTVGNGVTHLKVGDRVMGDGCVDLGFRNPGLSSTRASAEYQVFAQHKLKKLPASMSVEVSAAFSVGAQTAYSMINRLPLKKGEHVVVTGATSNTALFALQKLATKPVTVHAVTTSPHTATKLKAQGFKNICLINRNQPFLIQFQAYLSQHDVPFIDHVIDPFMDVYLPKLLPFIRRFGFYTSCGVARQSAFAKLDAYTTQGLSIAEVFSLILRKSITLIGNNLGESADLAEAIQDYEAGNLNVNIDKVFTHRDDIVDFVHQSLGNSKRFGKVIYQYDQNIHAQAES